MYYQVVVNLPLWLLYAVYVLSCLAWMPMLFYYEICKESWQELENNQKRDRLFWLALSVPGVLVYCFIGLLLLCQLAE